MNEYGSTSERPRRTTPATRHERHQANTPQMDRGTKFGSRQSNQANPESIVPDINMRTYTEADQIVPTRQKNGPLAPRGPSQPYDGERAEAITRPQNTYTNLASCRRRNGKRTKANRARQRVQFSTAAVGRGAPVTRIRQRARSWSMAWRRRAVFRERRTKSVNTHTSSTSPIGNSAGSPPLRRDGRCWRLSGEIKRVSETADKRPGGTYRAPARYRNQPYGQGLSDGSSPCSNTPVHGPTPAPGPSEPSAGYLSTLRPRQSRLFYPSIAGNPRGEMTSATASAHASRIGRESSACPLSNWLSSSRKWSAGDAECTPD